MSSGFCGIYSWHHILHQINNHILEGQILPFWQLHHQHAWCRFKTNFVRPLVTSTLEELLPRTILLIRSEIWSSLVLDCWNVGEEFILAKKRRINVNMFLWNFFLTPHFTSNQWSKGPPQMYVKLNFSQIFPQCPSPIASTPEITWNQFFQNVPLHICLKSIFPKGFP